MINKCLAAVHFVSIVMKFAEQNQSNNYVVACHLSDILDTLVVTKTCADTGTFVKFRGDSSAKPQRRNR